ncbi:shikimate dehydrogenase [Dermabacteraceae bacterium TAE3-ERU27]|nr:shikimate dehydrogenase [Dermabacteraceae bacterium TAE3-ERU27]
MIGSPIGHSLSPLLHNTAYRLAGVPDARYLERGIELATPAQAGEFLARTHLQGLSVTMPLKPWAAEVADESDETVAALGIANTLLRLPDGRWRAENHDVAGIAEALRPGLSDRSPRNALILGGGATALSAAAACLGLGATEISVAVRNPSRCAALTRFLEAKGAQVHVCELSSLGGMQEADIAVSTLPLAGAHQTRELFAMSGVALPSSTVFLDVLYAPWPAPLAEHFSNHCRVVGGGEMLLHQALGQLRSMVGAKWQFPVSRLRALLPGTSL